MRTWQLTSADSSPRIPIPVIFTPADWDRGFG